MKPSDERISPEYLKTQEEMHIGLYKEMQYGSIAHTIFPHIKLFIEKLKSKSVFDYGCGKQYLKGPIEKMGVSYEGYDPAIKKYSNLDISKKYDLVVCVDVMEHIEQEYQHKIMQDISTLASKHVVFTICPVEAKKVLSDGRNAHVCIAGTSYWLNLICQYFEPIQVANLVAGASGFYIVCNRKKITPKINQIGTKWNGSFKETKERLDEAGMGSRFDTLNDPNKILKEN
tara:strand:+ start:1238 stop:1927 length:690 start_codon:yes stop_codon:yes gene_type:complete